MDPLTSKFPQYSAFQFTGGSPIAFVDLDGRERLYYLAGAGHDQNEPRWNYVERFGRIWTEVGLHGFHDVRAHRDQKDDAMWSALHRNDEMTTITVPDNGQIAIHWELDGGNPLLTYQYVPDQRTVPLRDNDARIEGAFRTIIRDLTEHPLRNGESISIAGYSYGAVAAEHLSLKLADAGIHVSNLILIGVPTSPNSQLWNAVRQRFQIENVITVDIPGDGFSSPTSIVDFNTAIIGVAMKGDAYPHFDLARPGKKADDRIRDLGKTLKDRYHVP